MRTEEEIKQHLKECKESLAHRNMSDPLDRMIGGLDKVWINVLEWVLEESEQE